VPLGARQALARLAGVDVAQAPRSAIVTKDGVAPLEVIDVDIASIDAAAAAAAENEHPMLLLIAGVLGEQEAVALEDRGQAFVDAAGRAWVPGAPRTGRARTAAGSRTRPETLRAAQLLADHPDRPWSSPRLAQHADISQATADRLLRRLLVGGLLRREGSGRSARTFVEDIRGVRRWLLATAQPVRHVRLPCYVRDPDAIPPELGDLRLVRSGAHGAALLGVPVMSGQPRTMIRVQATGDELEQLPARLRGVRADRGANVLLIADPGRLASLDARQVDSIWVAPPSRVCVDMTLEPRGDAAADVFLDLWGDQVL
jgi:hypothetical protein